MSASDLNTVAYIFKKMYADGLGEEAIREHPHFNAVAKRGDFRGESFKYAVKYGNPQGVSSKFPNAQKNAAASRGMQFEAYRKSKFGVITLDGEAIAASEGNDGALIDLVTNETDSILAEMIDALAFDLYRDTSGMRGRVKAIAGNVITLTNVDDARNFKEDLVLNASAAADGTGLYNTAGVPNTTFVTAVDEDAGTVTVNDATAIHVGTGIAVNDYLYRDGDGGNCLEGLAVLTPLVAPAPGDDFRGKDRSVNPRRLAGARIDNVNVYPEENAGLVAIRISQTGLKADGYYLNPIRFHEVARRRDAKVEYGNAGGTAAIGFEYITISTTAGLLKCYADPDCPTNRGYLVRSSDEYVKHLRDLPHIVMDDGKPSLRQTSDDGIEARVRAWSNYFQTRPGCFGVHSI